MATTELNMKMDVVVISVEDLRKIIAEEIRKAVEPGAIRPPYLPRVIPDPLPPQWWQSPTITCESVSKDANQIVIN